jgi:sRNA-binding protein
MHGLPHGAILQQRVSTSALESRRAQARVQTIEKKERKKRRRRTAAAKIKHQNQLKIFIW